MTIRYEDSDPVQFDIFPTAPEHGPNMTHIPLTRRAFLIGSLALSGSAAAHDFQNQSIQVGHPWAYPTPGTDAAVVFLALVNRAGEADQLLGAECPRAQRAILMEYPANGGAARLLAAIELAPRMPVALRPGRRHIRLQQLDRAFRIGDRVPMTLIFARAERLTVEILVENEGSH